MIFLHILGTIIRTSLPENVNGQPLTDAEVNQKIAVSVQPFNGKTVVADTQQQTTLPILGVYSWWRITSSDYRFISFISTF